MVQFEPYRWVRHLVYASSVMLFAVHYIVLRAPLSLAFLIPVCLWYNGRKSEIEEGAMVEVFENRYRDYAKKVRLLNNNELDGQVPEELNWCTWWS